MSLSPRRFTRFRLATLLVAMAVASLWLGWQTYKANQQRAAVAVIQAAEGMVRLSSDETRQAQAKGSEPSVADRIKETIGRDYFESVTVVDLATNNGRRRGTMQPKAVPEVIAKLASLPELEILELGHNKTVDDEQLAHLGDLKKLKTAYLYRTNIRGAGLAHLAPLPELTSISLADTPLEDEGLAWLGRMPQLTWLRLDRTRITDAGLVHLAGATNLESLTCSYTDVSDAGLRSLERLSKLKNLSLVHTKVTAEGLQRIQQALPNCTVRGTFGLGVTPKDVEWFPDDREPSVAMLNARFKELQMDGQASSKPGTPGGAITELWLGSTTLSDRSMLDLVKRLPMLEQLNIRAGVVGDELLQGLAGRDRLTFLSLNETRVTNDGLAHLAKLPSLRELYLGDTQITDDGLRHLYPLKNLKQVLIDNIRVSDEAFQQLKQALPKTSISR
jgi:internalin A